MVTKDGESRQSEAQRVWTDQEERESGDDRRWTNRTGQPGPEVRSESLSPSRIDWERADSFVSSGDDTFGGTVQQLITETRDEISEIESRGEKLRQRLQNLEDLFGRLKENPVNQ